jgi:multiple sugar transport system permease protein
MLAPAIILIGAFILYPAINAIRLSFTSTNLLDTSAQQYIGFKNFTAAFTDSTFWLSIRNSLVWVVGCVTGQLVLGTIGALALNQRIRGRGLIRALVLIPWATSSILVALMWGWMLDPNLGIINHLLQDLGLQNTPVAWLGQTSTAMPTLILIDTWQGVPFFAVMILAALQGVPQDVIEAAKIDGANRWHTFWRVVLPLILPAVLITTVLRLIWTANYFDLILVLTNGGPANATLTLPLNGYQTAYRAFNLGQAAALGVIQAAILSVLIFFYARLVRKGERV